MLNRLATMATTAIAHRRVLSIFMTISFRNCQPPSNSRWQRLFKAVLNDKQARLFAELQACGESHASIRSAPSSNTGPLDTKKRSHRSVIDAGRRMNGQASKMAVDSQTGRLRVDNDDDDDD